jgi:hypothetical protein
MSGGYRCYRCVILEMTPKWYFFWEPQTFTCKIFVFILIPSRKTWYFCGLNITPGVTGGVINTKKIANKIRWRVCKWHPNLFPSRLQLSHLSSPTSKTGTDTSKRTQTMASFPTALSLNQKGLYQPALSAAASCISTHLNARWFAAAAPLLICRCLLQPSLSIIWYIMCTTGLYPSQNNHNIHSSRLHISASTTWLFCYHQKRDSNCRWCPSPLVSNFASLHKNYSWYSFSIPIHLFRIIYMYSRYLF